MNAEKKRQDIIETGMRLFTERGFSAVSVEDICRELGISKPTLYKYISKKEMILSFYYQQRTLDALPGTYEYLSQNRPGAALGHLFHTLNIIAYDMGPELYSAYRIYTLSDHEYLSVYSRPQVRVLELCIQGLQNQDLITSRTDPHKLAVILMDLHEGLSLTWASNKGDFDLPGTFQSWVQITLGVRQPAVPSDQVSLENAG